jgi:hypoxanthine phosphoribosyltransferase
MTNASTNDLWVTWDEYHQAIEKLILLVHESGWEFDQVLCLARGGLRPGDIFSRVFNVPLAILAASSYREESGTVRGTLDIAKSITMTGGGTLSGKVLLVDDLVDSGITLERVQNYLRHDFPAVTEVRSAVIWCKACSSIKPDYYLDYLEDNPWIHQPFETYDSLCPQQLAKRLGEK